MAYSYAGGYSGGYGYTSYFDNSLYFQLSGPGDYRYAQSQVGTLSYKGFAYEGQNYGKYYSTTSYDPTDGYYKHVVGYIRSSDHIFTSETLYADGTSFYSTHYVNDYSGNPFRGYSGFYENYQAADGSSTVYSEHVYETFGPGTPVHYTKGYETVQTNAYGTSTYYSGYVSK